MSKNEKVKCSVSLLRDNGYRVRVGHFRELRYPLYVAITSDSPSGLDFVCTRREYESDSAQRSSDIRWGQNVVAFGGFTSIEITTPNGETLKTKHNFNRDAFCKRIGVEKALKKILYLLPTSVGGFRTVEETVGC